MDDFNIFFDSWMSVLRIVVVATLGYAAMIALLRASGKRTLTQMNGFDFVITITLGASFGRVLTAREVGVVEAVTAFAMLVALQYAVAALHTHSPAFARILSAQPALLYYKGNFLRSSMKRALITEGDVLAAIRRGGAGSIAEIEAVILETNGRLSVIERTKSGDGSALTPLMEAPGSEREPA